jgi:T5SS/PEP-CTERM-associated repeat protein
MVKTIKHRPLFLFAAAALLTLSAASTLRAQDLVVGNSSSGNTTNITSGTNSYDNTVIGNNVGADSNSLTVDGSGTLLTNSADVTVGQAGSGNSLVISDGGTVQSSGGFIGNEVSAANNSVLVTGTNSIWTNSGGISVGESGSGSSPEPSTYVAVLGLLALMLWPLRRRLRGKLS